MTSFNHSRVEIPLLGDDTVKDAPFENNEQLPLFARESPTAKKDNVNHSMVEDNRTSSSGSMHRVVMQNPFADCQSTSSGKQSRDTMYNRSSQSSNYHYHRNFKRHRSRSKSPERDYKRARHVEYSGRRSNDRSRGNNRDDRKGDYMRDDDFDHDNNSLKWSPRTYSGRTQPQRNSPHYGRLQASQNTGNQRGSFPYTERNDPSSFRPRGSANFDDLAERGAVQQQKNHNEPVGSAPSTFQDKRKEHAMLYNSFQQDPQVVLIPQQSMKGPKLLNLIEVASKIVMDESELANIKSVVKSCMSSGATNTVPALNPYPQAAVSPHPIPSTTNRTANTWKDGSLLGPYHANSTLAVPTPPFTHSKQPMSNPPPMHGIATQQPHSNVRGNWSNPIPVRASNMHVGHHKPARQCAPQDGQFVNRFPAPKHSPNNSLYYDHNKKRYPSNDNFWRTTNQMSGGNNSKSVFNANKEGASIPGLDMQSSSPARNSSAKMPLLPTPVHKPSSSRNQGTNPIPVQVPVEKPYSVPQNNDGGDIRTCSLCGSFGSSIVLHYVNLHPDEEVPCKLDIKALQTAIREKIEVGGDSESNNVTESNPVEDLSWLPDGDVFPDAVCCKYCDVESNMRYYMIEHLKTHAGQKIHKRQVNAKIRRVQSTDLFCRFCEFQTPDMTEFSEHVTAHTGEFAYGCCYCNYRCPTMAQAKSHVQMRHSNKQANISVNNKKDVSGKVLEGHACSLCGYVQLDVNTTVAHIKAKHPRSTDARTVTINMSKLVYKLVPVDKIVSTDAEKSDTQVEKPKCDNISIAAQSIPTVVPEQPNEPLIEKDTQDKNIQEVVPDKQKQTKKDTRSVAKKSDCSDLKSTKSLKECGGTEKPSSAVGVAETAWKGAPAKLNDTVAKLRAQLVKDGASIAAADTEIVVEQSSGRKASYLEKLQSWATREKMYICGMPYCVSVCNSEDGLAKHRDFMHKDLTIALCRECDLTLPSITELFTHLRGPAHADYKKKFVCSAESVCQFTSVSGKIFMEHTNKKHGDKQWLTCFWCNKKVLSSQALTEHMESKCSIQKKLLATYVKYGLDGLPDDLPDIEDEERNKEQDVKLRCDETRSLDSLPSDMEQDPEADRSDNRPIYESLSTPSIRLISANEQRESETGKRLAPPGEECAGLVEAISPKRSKTVQKPKPFDLSATNAPKSSENAGGGSSRNKAESATDKVKSTLVERASGSNVEGPRQSHNKLNKCPREPESSSPVPQTANNKPAFHPKSILKPNSVFEPATRLSTSRPFSSAVLPSFSHAKTTIDSKVVKLEPNTVSNNSPAPVTAEKGINDELSLHISSVVSLAIPEPTLKHNDLKDSSSHAKEILNSKMSNEPKPKIASRMDTTDIYGALAASCMIVKTGTFQPHSLSLDKNQASLLKDVPPIAERAAIRKTKKTHTTMMGEASLRHLYKCPGKHCTYTTDDESNFWQHMSDAKKEKDRVCVYCLEVFERPETLIHHVREIHGASAYQCAHCFYRAKTQMMILLHIHLHHSDLQAKSFIVPTVCEYPKQDPLKAKDVLKFVKPLVCGQDLCSYATLEEDDFKNHMKNSHLTISQSKCFYCSKKLDLDVLPIHFKEHGILKYNCLLCEWGTDDDTASMVHMCENHPEQTGRLFIRGTCDSKMFHMAVSINSAKQSAPLPSDHPKESVVETPQTASEDVPKEIADDSDAGTVISRSNQEKYKCGYSNCQFSAEDVARLKSHMKMCYLIHKGHSLQCPTCKILFQDHAEYSAHVPSHDVRRYSCGLCSFRAQLPHYVKHHIRSYHRISFEDMKCMPTSQPADLDSAEFVFVQKSPKNSPQKSGETTNNPSASAPRGNPSVIDSVDHVPQQSIFQTEKMCAWCGYSTKVRLNLIRHLEKHKSQPLQFPLPIPIRTNSPDSAPTTSKSTATLAVQNAVETAEEPVKSPMNWSEEPDQECPQYVPSNEVYRCSIAGCHYLAVDRSLYECHINTLHGNCRVLPCPHCPEQLHSVAVLIRHLRLHGPNLYRCSECDFLGMSKQSIKIHSSNTHGVFNSYTVIRDADGELQVGRPARKLLQESEHVPRNVRHGCGGNAKALDVMWECGICDMKGSSRMEIKKHLSEKHLLSVLYRCSACGHGEKTHGEVQQHVKTAHPRTEVAIEDLVRWRRLRGDRNTGERIRKSPVKPRQDAQAESSLEKRFTCYLCKNYKSNYKADMRLHIFREMGYYKFSCGYCKMKFFCVKLANKHSCQGSRKQSPDIVVDADEDVEREVNARLSSQEVKVNTQHREDSAGRSPLPAELECSEILESASPEADEDVPVSDNSSEVYLYKCPSCRYKTNAKSGVRKHLLRHLQYRPYRCGHCGARFPKPKQCLTHHDSQHDGLPVDIENDVDQRCLQFVAMILKTLGTTASKNNELPETPLLVGNTWQCSFDDCNVKTTSLKSLLDHFTCHVPRSAFRCGLCPFSGNSKSTVEVHCRKAHTGHASVLEAKPRPGSDGGEEEVPLEDGSASISATSTTYECPFCPYSDSFPNNVTRHALRHYDFRFYSCGHCGTECLEPCDVEEHSASEHPNLQVLVKTVKKPDSLKACNDQPCSSSEDQGHQFKCSKCAFETMDLSRIRAHCKESHDPLSIFIRVEPPGQDPEVPVCVLGEEEPDEREIRGISDAKPIDVPDAKYYCNYCDHAAGSHEDLESHWESQHHQLPFIVSVPQPSYQCPQCEFTSLDMEMIKRHVTIHLKRYMCQRCGKEVHTFVEGVQHSKLVHPNVAVELIPHPKGTEKAIQELIDGVRVEPNLSKQCGESLKAFVAPRSGRKMARKQCRSSKFTPKLKRRASARKGLPRAVKKPPFVVPRPTDEEMNKYFCRVPKSTGFKFNGVFSLRQLSEKLNLFPIVRVEEKCSLFK